MQNAIISDTSCLILLTKIGELELLQKLYGKIITTHEVALEYGEKLPAWIELKDPQNKNYQVILETQLDKGEASAIALSIENKNSVLIIDELKGRKCAISLGLNVTGTLGIIVEAKLSGIIPSAKTLLEKIKLTNFRVSNDLEKIILLKVNE